MGYYHAGYYTYENDYYYDTEYYTYFYRTRDYTINFEDEIGNPNTYTLSIDNCDLINAGKDLNTDEFSLDRVFSIIEIFSASEPFVYAELFQRHQRGIQRKQYIR